MQTYPSLKISTVEIRSVERYEKNLAKFGTAHFPADSGQKGAHAVWDSSFIVVFDVKREMTPEHCTDRSFLQCSQLFRSILGVLLG